MFKFGMTDYEVNQNIVGVAIMNFVVLGAIGGIAVGAAAVGALVLLAKVIF